jgi:ATP-binding cassette, subfamily C (CFTR/MRP), member 1
VISLGFLALPLTAVNFDSPLLVVVSAAVGSGLCALSIVEHRRSIRPSSFLILYLLACIIRDVIQLTAPVPNHVKDQNSALTASRLLISMVLLISESRSKTAVLNLKYQDLSPEETAGILERVSFWWINLILRKGLKSVLTADDLPSVDAELSSKALRGIILQAWSQRRLSRYTQ